MSDNQKTFDVLIPALRQYQHNDCSGFVSGFDYDETQKIVAGLQAINAELLEALKGLVAETKDGLGYEYDDGEWPALDKARAAIEKATGEQQ